MRSGSRLLVCVDAVHADAREEVAGRAQTHGLRTEARKARREMRYPLFSTFLISLMKTCHKRKSNLSFSLSLSLSLSLHSKSMTATFPPIFSPANLRTCAMAGVPASNLPGGGAKVECVRNTSSIISPPPCSTAEGQMGALFRQKSW